MAIMMQLNAGKIGSSSFPFFFLACFCPSNTCKLMMLGCWEQSHHIKCEKRQCQKGFPFNTYFRYRLTFWCRQPQQQVSLPIKKRQRRLRNSRVEAQTTGGGEEEKHFWLAILWQTQAQVLGIHPKSIFHARKTIWTSLTYNNSTPLLLVCHSKDT